MVLDPDDARHGSIGGYFNHKCRCEKCSAAASTYNHQRYVQARTAAGLWPRRLKGRTHGTISSYNAGCHCPQCREAARIKRQAQRERVRDES